MSLLKRLKKIEGLASSDRQPPGIAIRFLDGYVKWNGRVFENSDTFQKAVDKIFANTPPSPGPRVILITLHRNMKSTPN